MKFCIRCKRTFEPDMRYCRMDGGILELIDFLEAKTERLPAQTKMSVANPEEAKRPDSSSSGFRWARLLCYLEPIIMPAIFLLLFVQTVFIITGQVSR